MNPQGCPAFKLPLDGDSLLNRLYLPALFLDVFPGLRQDAAQLVERLRSENVQEREEASRALKTLGPAAVALLEKAAWDADGSVPGRV